MKFILEDSGPKLNEPRLKQFEKLLGHPLPADYRDFLLIHNGGVPEPDVLFHFIENSRTSDSALDQFYRIAKSTEDCTTLAEAVEIYLRAGRLPAHLLPIANDQFGNQVCISFTGSDCGTVYFWNHELELRDSPTQSVSYSLISESFSKFLDLLIPIDS